MNRIQTILLFLALTFVSFAKEKRPNILLIYTDDHSHRTVSCYPEAYPWVKTPNIDALAANGVRFASAYVGTWCMPSRATLLTGHHQHGIQSMRMAGKYPGSEYDPKKCPFWPKVFRKHGYQTAQVGKWHTGTDTGAGRDWDYQKVWNRPRYPQNAGNYYKDQLIETNGGKPVMTKGYSTDNYTRWAVDYLKGEQRDPKKPWYLWVCYGAVHSPFTPAKRHLEAYPEAKVPVPADIYPPRPGKPAFMQQIGQWYKADDGLPHLKGSRRSTGQLSPGKGIHGSDLNSWVRQYQQGALALDESVGKLIQTLKETGQYDNTLILFTADQGFAWGQHGFRSKVAAYDANIRCPFIVSMPSQLPTGKTCASPVSGVDVAPTFFSFAGIDLPWDMHGRDLTPLLKKPEQAKKRSVLTVFTGRKYGSDTDVIPTNLKELRKVAQVSWYASLHDGRFKYIRTFEKDEIEELYDLQKDPEELTNLALLKKHGARLVKMRAQTIAELKRTKAGFADNLPPTGTDKRAH